MNMSNAISVTPATPGKPVSVGRVEPEMLQASPQLGSIVTEPSSHSTPSIKDNADSHCDEGIDKIQVDETTSGARETPRNPSSPNNRSEEKRNLLRSAKASFI